MKQYEITFIVDPVLSGDEISATAQTYVDHLKTEGSMIVHVDEMGLKQLAYPINRRTSGVYYSVEFKTDSGTLIPKLELAMNRDERIMRFLTVRLDKYGVKYNEDKRNGLIGKRKKEEEKQEEKPSGRDRDRRDNRDNRDRRDRRDNRDRDRRDNRDNRDRRNDRNNDRNERKEERAESKPAPQTPPAVEKAPQAPPAAETATQEEE